MSAQPVLSEARRWIGTPYQHQCSTPGAGTDCLGLIRGVWRALYGREPMDVPPYTPDWAQETGRETLLEAARACLTPVSLNDAGPGHVLLFRMQTGARIKHAAIKSAPDRMIHAYWGRSVTETFLIPYWQRRCVYAFAFPDITL